MTTDLYLPEFYRRYDIAADADERNLKKAYARELKKIDQATQADQFQQLREHYEQALVWLKHRSERVYDAQADSIEQLTELAIPLGTEQTKADISENESNSQAINPDIEPSLVIATDALALTQSLTPQQTAMLLFQKLRNLTEDEHCQKETLCELFSHIVRETALAHIDTRAYFEHALVSYLLEGWASHKHWLFKLATMEFDWQYSNLRYLNHEASEILLQTAIQELQRFEQVPATSLKPYQKLLQQAREGLTLTDEILISRNNLLHTLLTNYEHLLWFYSDVHRLTAWYEKGKELRFAINQNAKKIEPGKPGKLFPYLILILLVLLIYGASQQPESGKRSAVIHQVSTDSAANYLSRGEDHFFGRNGNPVNFDLARTQWEQAVKLGSSEAAMYLARLYETKTDAHYDLKMALRWYERASELGQVRAGLIAGDFYFWGQAGAIDYAKAAEWYEKCISPALPICKTKLAMALSKSKNAKQTNPRILSLLKQAANAGELNALEKLAVANLNGSYGLKQNIAEGMRLLRVSAEMNEIAQYELGQIYQRGLFGQMVDKSLAADWFVLAANNQHKEAQKEVEMICKNKRYAACKNLKATQH